MNRRIVALAAACAAPLLAAAMARGPTPPALQRLGWQVGIWTGIPPIRFSATEAGGIRVQGQGEAGFLYRASSPGEVPQCLSWRWRVDAGPPPTDLQRRGGDDRALSIAVGFNGYAPGIGLWDRAKHAAVQATVGDRSLPRSVLSYTWGGTQAEASQGFLSNPWSPDFARLRVLRPAQAAMGEWVEEKVDLGADWRAAFGSAKVPDVQEIAISADTDDTNSQLDAQVEALHLGPCG